MNTSNYTNVCKQMIINFGKKVQFKKKGGGVNGTLKYTVMNTI